MRRSLGIFLTFLSLSGLGTAAAHHGDPLIVAFSAALLVGLVALMSDGHSVETDSAGDAIRPSVAD